MKNSKTNQEDIKKINNELEDFNNQEKKEYVIGNYGKRIPIEYFSLEEPKQINIASKLEEVSSKSITTNKVEVANTKNNSKNKNKFFYRKIVPLSLAVAISLGTAVYTLKDIKETGKSNAAIAIVIKQAERNLEAAGIITIRENGTIKMNNYISNEAYQNIGITDPSIAETYAYKKVLEKAGANLLQDYNLISSITYSDGTKRYKDWADYCKINGLVDSNGNPSIQILETYGKKELLEAYENGTIDNIVKDTSKNTRGRK